jgi:hypothetical protein
MKYLTAFLFLAVLFSLAFMSIANADEPQGLPADRNGDLSGLLAIDTSYDVEAFEAEAIANNEDIDNSQKNGDGKALAGLIEHYDKYGDHGRPSKHH